MASVAPQGLTLGIETSTSRASLAVGRAGEVIAARELAGERRRTVDLFPALAAVLGAAGQRLADVSCVCFSRGPGSFTGLRIAATVARMLHATSGARVVAVPTLEVIAHAALAHPDQPARLAVVLDARRGQVFGGLFERRDEGWETVAPAAVVEPQAWLTGLGPPLWITGEGIAGHAAAVAAAVTATGATALDESYWTPRAEALLAVGQRYAAAGKFCAAGEIIPLYLRPPECEEVYEARRAAARQRHGA